MSRKKKLVLVGDSAFAEICYEYFSDDSDYSVEAFAVEQEFLKRSSLFGLPVVPLDSLEVAFPATEYRLFVAIAYGQLNRLRTRLYLEAKKKGYGFANYVSSRAFVWKNVEIGENCFIFENNVIQPFVKLGNNIILWSGNHVGHHSTIHDNCFISSHVVLSGYVEVGQNCFLGVNSAISNNLTIARDCWIGPGVTISKDTAPGEVFKLAPAQPSGVSSWRLFKVQESK